MSTSRTYRWPCLAEFFSLHRNIVGPFPPFYLGALGGEIVSVGLLSGMDNLEGTIHSFPCSYLSERFGTKRAPLLFNRVAMAGGLIVELV